MKPCFVLCLLGLLLPLALHAQPPGGDLYAITRLQKGIRSKRISSFDTTGNNNDRIEHIRPGEKRTLFQVQGAGMINHIWITIAPPPEVLNRDDLVLRMYWDGNPSPSVESPLGSFFGQGWNESYPLYSQPLTATPLQGRALTSYFVMPFAKGARIELENQSDRDVDAFYYYVDYLEMDKLPASTGRFHAWYNQQLTQTDAQEGENEWGVLGPQRENPRGERNYLFADIRGKGQFVGVNYYIHTPTPIWYGEGDDMIFIDGSARNGSTRPTLNGTGTEDYFNTSWSPKTSFQTPYFGYPRVNTQDAGFAAGWGGRTHMYRFHIVDPLYFEQSLKFTIEHGHNNVLVMDLRSVAYWYLSEATAVPAIPPKAERAFRPEITPVDVMRWREAWRQSKGNATDLWGNEQE
ncbi:Protein of unknown function [Catalinimonas alkaloidigena]|uniref:DUF2961 domain-containing protein n=1 Tax=Catalinimonas alkaloidigena TaxID=1075417 RepID=A0A1G9R2U6_9BACT|nr:glycoside hydrolase family 172 protein [Catalinimonas alkaloidigena]SDM17606.1 Protein of unknown function [Catalinimonas alkaloidigena]